MTSDHNNMTVEIPEEPKYVYIVESNRPLDIFGNGQELITIKQGMYSMENITHNDLERFCYYNGHHVKIHKARPGEQVPLH